MKDYKFKINGNDYAVNVYEIVDNVAKVEVNGRSYNVELEKRIEKPTPVVRKPRPVSKPVSSAETTAAAPTPTGSGKAVHSPLPGVILELRVNNGDHVKKGQILLVMEAMKMENNIAADNDGTVVNIKVTKGQSVLQNDVLLEIQ